MEGHEDRALFLVEDKYDVTAWKGEFSRSYIEEITRKTGREKTFGQFLALIGQTIKQSLASQDMFQTKNGFMSARNKQTYFIDLLGYEDLQLLKAKRDYHQASL